MREFIEDFRKELIGGAIWLAVLICLVLVAYNHSHQQVPEATGHGVYRVKFEELPECTVETEHMLYTFIALPETKFDEGKANSEAVYPNVGVIGDTGPSASAAFQVRLDGQKANLYYGQKKMCELPLGKKIGVGLKNKIVKTTWVQYFVILAKDGLPAIYVEYFYRVG